MSFRCLQLEISFVCWNKRSMHKRRAVNKKVAMRRHVDNDDEDDDFMTSLLLILRLLEVKHISMHGQRTVDTAMYPKISWKHYCGMSRYS